MNNYPISRKANIVVQEFETEVLIYDLKINKAFCLNQTSAMIWELCDGKYSIEQISQILRQKLNEPITEDLIWLALDQFKRDGLLENNEQFEINFHGLNRRQIIKKIGFTSLATLPVIASVVAPAAALTSSLGELFAPCSSPGSCLSGMCSFNGFGSNFCCVSTAGGVAGQPGSGVVCTTDQVSCNTLALSQCCSGMVSAGFPSSVCSDFGGFRCNCN